MFRLVGTAVKLQGVKWKLSPLANSVIRGFPVGSNGKQSTCSAGVSGWGRSPAEGNGNPPQYSCLGNPMDKGAWKATVHESAELDTTEQLITHI